MRVAPSGPTGLARCEHCAGRSGAPQRKLASVKKMGLSAKTRADLRFLQALAYQAQLDAGP